MNTPYGSGTIACIIPCKPYHQAKTRLADCLSLEQRIRLSRWLLQRALCLVRGHLPCVVVISRDPQVLKDAKRYGGLPLEEEGDELNAALVQASQFVLTRGVTGILILPTDLPFLTDEDVRALLRAAVGTPAVVIAPCQRGTGTNALLIRPPLFIPFQFGTASFARHVASAQAMGIQPAIVRTPTLAFDLDTPEDWYVFCEQCILPHSLQRSPREHEKTFTYPAIFAVRCFATLPDVAVRMEQRDWDSTPSGLLYNGPIDRYQSPGHRQEASLR